jgi:Matrixin/Putative peptidoglycan binding domain
MCKHPAERAQKLAKIVHREGARGEGVAQIKQLLTRLGYHPAADRTDRYGAEMTRAVRIFQAYFHLPITGNIDVQTLRLLRSPRCGVRDIPEGVDLEALSASLGDSGSEADDPFTFRFNSGPWETYDLRYQVYNGSPDLSTEVECCDAAFQVWEGVSPLRFTRVNTAEEAHIRLGFESGHHGDGSSFDGAGHILAHGFFPRNGRIHFDEAENWRDWRFGNGGGNDLWHVAIHEIGHALGLGHSRLESTIMYPFANNGRHTLAEEDIRGILSLYPFRVGAGARATVVNLWAFAGGTGSALVDFGRRRRFLAFGHATFVDSLTDYDRDNACALDVFRVDGELVGNVAFGGDHLGTNGAPSNLFPGAYVGVGRTVQFRLSTFHSSDLEAYGVGCVLALD